jgi:hypothetical protein
MKRISIVVIATVVLLAPHIATAKDFCFDIGGPALLVFKDFSVPAKGNCKPLVQVNSSFPGLVASGAGCTTSDGKTLLFTESDGFFDGIETIQGSITLASGSGNGTNCTAPDSGTTFCSQFSLAVAACPKKAAPITADLNVEISKRSQLGR